VPLEKIEILSMSLCAEKEITMDDNYIGYFLYSTNNDETLITEALSLFTDIELLCSWIEEFLIDNPNSNIFFEMLLLNPSPGSYHIDNSHYSGEGAILHTMKNGHIEEILCMFTDTDKFIEWAEDFVKKNPSIDLYYTVLAVNPLPGERLHTTERYRAIKMLSR
jgi:hypothetical protein